MICFPLDNTEYEAMALGAWCATRTRGVFSADGHYAVTANDDMTVTVSPGIAWLKANDYWGVSAFESNSIVLTVDTADGALSRIDAVCVRLDKNQNKGEIVIKKGSYSPQPPVITPPVRNLDYDEIYIATIAVAAGATSIGQIDVTDQRLNEEYCGLMRDGIEKIPTQALYDQYEAFLAESTQTVSAWMQDSEAEFEAWMDNQSVVWDDWFSTIQDALGDDVAGQLLLMILDTDDQLSAHTDDQAIHVTPAEKAAWNKAASGASPTALYASAGDLIDATADIQATKGKALVGSVTTDTAAGTQVISLALGSQPLAYGTYSCVVRLKSNYSGSAGTNFLTLKVEHISGDAPTTLGTASIRDSDVYRTDNYCVFAMGFDFLGPWAEGDSFRLTVEAAAAVEATVSLDYVAVNLAGATLLTL